MERAGKLEPGASHPARRHAVGWWRRRGWLPVDLECRRDQVDRTRALTRRQPRSYVAIIRSSMLSSRAAPPH
jgi:hypothetical protein